MSYLQDRKKKNSRIRNVAIVVVILLVSFYFHASLFAGLSQGANKFFKPVINVGNNIATNFKNLGIFFASKKSLEAENKQLKQELLNIQSRVADYSVLENDNNAFKDALGRKNPTASFVLSAILSKPNKSAYDTLLIDAGKNEGVAAGDVVFAHGNIPIGKIVEVFNTSAKVTLFSTSGEKNEVIINGMGASMELIGRGGGNFEMVLPRDFELKEGTDVTLPGIASYVVAKVVTIISDPRDSYKKALLASPINFQELKFVEVQKNGF